MYKRQELGNLMSRTGTDPDMIYAYGAGSAGPQAVTGISGWLLYTSDAADERSRVDLGGRRIIKKKNKRSKERTQQNNNTRYIVLKKVR